MRVFSIFSFIFCYLLALKPTYGQNYYFKSIEGDNTFIPYGVLAQSNGNVLCTGTIFGGIGQNQFLMQTDDAGDFLQNKEYTIPGTTFISNFCKANDGNTITMTNKMVNKVSPTGEVIWSKKINENTLNSALYRLSSGYLLSTCVPIGNNNALCNTLIIKLDENGQQVWQQIIGKEVNISSFVEDIEGFIYACGRKTTLNQDTKGLLSKLSANGSLLWSKTYKLNDDEFFNKIQLSPDNGLVLFGNATGQSLNDVIWITKTDNDGLVKWSKTYENSDKDLKYVLATSSDGYIFSANEALNGTILNKINQAGELLWSYMYKSNNAETLMSDLATTNDGILGVGITYSAGPKGGFMFKTDKNGIIPDCCPLSYELTVKDVLPTAVNFIEPIVVDVQWLDNVLLAENSILTLTSLCQTPNLEFTLSKDTLCPSECLDVNFTNPTAGYQYSWVFRNGTPNISNMTKPETPICFEQEGTIILTATKDGCSKNASKTIIIQKPNDEIPNAFTPNGDGTNDKFKPFILDCPLRDYHLKIFNRWGEMVFESTEFLEAWDGITPNGFEAPQDVYVWLVDYSEIKDGTKVGVTKKGDVTVLR
jgi:gliding motility-associated-like protein